ncbi:folate-Biopterin Transporter (FBT) family [Thraustotheca clavata]|uniref:Folate-Biopterin Transporter (FBT) family n=1 Tax=Thraustotheca clavata TaxID=74557 RepID=A0A1W0A0J6_9STRA|nr:folate-Biopterin Transporter (FBT) family [Thraustotheca clavata]
MMKNASLLPIGLLSLYFIQSFLMSFPMTAYISWVSDTIHMSPATTNFYYALTFFPWNLKPIYALISDNYPLFGYHRKYYIVICEIISALSILATGLFIRSVTGAFIVKFIDSACEAFTQMMLGIVLVDVASGDRAKSSSAQSWANAVKNAAAIVALIAGIPVYADKSILATTVISWTAVVPLTGVFVAIYILRERKSTLSAMAAMDDHPKNCNELIEHKWNALRKTVSRIVHEQWNYIPVMIFFFLCSALPSGGTVWYQYTYFLLKKEQECLQYSSLAGMVGRVVSCAIYSKVSSGKSIRMVFAISTILSTLAGLPQILLAPPIAELPVSVCTFCTFESFITSFAGEFALLQLLVVATYYCPPKKELHGLTYALYLSFMDFGGVTSSFLSAILISALGITQDPTTFEIDYTNLWCLVVIGAVLQIVILAFLCLLPTHVDMSGSHEDEKQALITAEI